MTTERTSGFNVLVSRLVPATSVLAITVGCIVLIGWIFDIAALKSILPIWVSMKADTAICFVLMGIALLLTPLPFSIFKLKHSILFSYIARLCSLIVVLIGMVTLVEYASNWNPGIDQWLFVEPVGTVGTSNPGRMAPETALSFLLLTSALWIYSYSRKTRLSMLTSVSCGLLVTALALAAIQSYFTPDLGPFGWFGLTIMAVHTAILFTMLGASIIVISWQQSILPWSLSWRTTAAFACGMLLLVFIALNISRSQFSSKEDSRQMAYSEKVLADIDGVVTEAIDAQAHAIGYIITNDEQNKTRYLEAQSTSIEKLDVLRKLVADNPHQQHLFAQIEIQIKGLFQGLQTAVDGKQSGIDAATNSKMVSHADSLLHNLHATFKQIESEHRQQLVELKLQSENMNRSLYITTAASTFVSLLVFLMVLFKLNFALNERKSIATKLQKSNNFLKSVLENVPVRIFWKDIDSRYLGCNTEFAKDTGFTHPSELVGKTDYDMGWKSQAELYRADDKAVMDSALSKLNFEEPSTAPDGNTIWLRTSKVPLRNENNQIIGILGIYQNITEFKISEDSLRKSEERYRSLFENMLEGYAYCKMLFEDGVPLDFTYLNVNKAFEKITGLTDVNGKNVNVLIPNLRATNPELFEIYGRVALTGQPEKFETYVEELGVWFSITAYSPQNGFFVAVFDNINERKQAELQLNEQINELRRWQEATMGREIRILELKDEVNKLLVLLGEPPRYSSTIAVSEYR